MVNPVVILGVLIGVLSPMMVGAQERYDLRRDDRADFGPPVDQGIEDVGAGLARSGRVIDPGLRVPSGFQQVYRVPGRPGWLMRVDGAIYALFRESVYDERGPLIPPGTIFHIGGIPLEPMAPHPDLIARSNRLDARLKAIPLLHQPADPRITAQSPSVMRESNAARPTPQPAPLTEALRGGIVDDGPYRRVRLRELLLAAADAERRRKGEGAE